MAYTHPILQLPPAPETVAFEAVENILRTDPQLKHVVRHWTTWTGEPLDMTGPTYATCPYLALAPMPQPSAWESEGQHRMPMLIGIQAAIVGTDVRQLMNYWGAIRRALWPYDVGSPRFQWVRERHEEAHIIKPTLTLAAYGSRVVDKGIHILSAGGQLRLLLHVDTP